MDDLTPLECYIAQIGALDRDLAAAEAAGNQAAIDAFRGIIEDTLDYIEDLRTLAEQGVTDDDDPDDIW